MTFFRKYLVKIKPDQSQIVTVPTNNSMRSLQKNNAESSTDEDPFEFMMKRPVITLYSQKMKGLKDLLLAEKLNTHAISLQVTAQSVASKKIRGIDKLGNHTTTSTYATAHVPGNNLQSLHTNYNAVLSDSNTNSNDNGSTATTIAASRPKRSRRE
uniref:Menin n=1 Tax=Bactrocera dorsalis TaxID=27457 RepID=A0A034VQP7_BACDO